MRTAAFTATPLHSSCCWNGTRITFLCWTGTQP
jgi:hypothetical protein